MQTSKCNKLIERARKYERLSKKQYHAEGGGETEVWYETIHYHFEEVLLPEIKTDGDELFIEYWPARFAIDREREMRQGITDYTFYKYEYGSYGTGYVCVTSRKIYLVVLDKLTKLFPLHKASLTGFLLDALAKQINRLRPIPGDHSRTLTPTQIYSNSFASGHDENERTKLTTAVGTWELFDHFVDQKGEMHTAIECLCNGAFSALRPKWHVTKRPPVISEAELLRRISKKPSSLSLLPATPDPIRAERGARMLDLHYLAAQVAGQGGGEVEADLAHAAAARPHDVQLNKLRNVFAGIRHLLDRCTNEAEVLNTLHLRIDRLPELAELYNRSVGRLQHPYFRNWHSLPDKPHPALVRTLEIGNLHDPSSLGNEMLAYIWGHQPNTLITGGNDGVIRVWNLLSATIINSFTAFQLQPEDSPRAVRIKQLLLSPDGSALLAVTSSKQLKAWNTGDWSLRFHIEAEDGIDDCAFSPNGAYFAYRHYRSNAIRVCDSGTGERIQHLPSYTGLTLRQGDEVISFRWGPSGDWMVLSVAEGGGFDNRVIGINVQSGEELFAFYCFDPHHFEIAPSGDSIFVHSGANPSLDVWSLAAGYWTHTVERPDYGRWALSPSGKFVASGFKDGQIIVFETHSGEPRYSLLSNAGQVLNCIFSPDGRFLLSFHHENRLTMWDLTRAGAAFEPPKYFISAGKDARRARSCMIANAIPVSSTLIVANQYHDAAMLDTASGEISPRYTAYPEGYFRPLTTISLDELQYAAVEQCAVSADGKRLLLMDRDSWAVFDTVKLTRTYGVENAFPRGATVSACALSADSRWVAVAVNDVLQIWDLSTGQFSTLSAKTKIQSCTFDPKSQWVAFASGDIISGEPEFQIYNLHTNELHPFDNPLIPSQRMYLREPLPALDELRCIWNCAATPDGTRIFAAHRYGAISVWDVKSLGLVQFWQALNIGFSGRMACKSMPDGKTVLTAGSDGAVRLWEVDTGKCLCAIQTEGILEDCDVFPDGRHLAAVGEAGVHWLEVIGL